MPPQVPHDLVELDQEDDDEQDIVVTDTDIYCRY